MNKALRWNQTDILPVEGESTVGIEAHRQYQKYLNEDTAQKIGEFLQLNKINGMSFDYCSVAVNGAHLWLQDASTLQWLMDQIKSGDMTMADVISGNLERSYEDHINAMLETKLPRQKRRFSPLEIQAFQDNIEKMKWVLLSSVADVSVEVEGELAAIGEHFRYLVAEITDTNASAEEMLTKSKEIVDKLWTLSQDYFPEEKVGNNGIDMRQQISRQLVDSIVKMAA